MSSKLWKSNTKYYTLSIISVIIVNTMPTSIAISIDLQRHRYWRSILANPVNIFILHIQYMQTYIHIKIHTYIILTALEIFRHTFFSYNIFSAASTKYAHDNATPKQRVVAFSLLLHQQIMRVIFLCVYL